MGTNEQSADSAAVEELSSEQILERAIRYALEQGAQALEQDGVLDPFTVLIEGEELYLEDHPGDSEEQSYASARRTIYQMERLCNAYLFCYDGYVDLEDGRSDALVVEYAHKGDLEAQIIVRMYHLHGDHYHFDETLYQVGETDTLFSEGAGQGGAEQSEAEQSEAKQGEADDVVSAEQSAITQDPVQNPAQAPVQNSTPNPTQVPIQNPAQDLEG
jgi:hypothetical protein